MTSSLSTYTDIIDETRLVLQNMVQYLEISCFLFHELGTLMPRHSSHHFNSAIVWPSIGPVNFAPGISASVNRIVSGSFLLVIPSLLAIIIQFSLVNNTFVNKSLYKQLLMNAPSALIHTTPSLLWFSSYFCFSNKHK